jgi:hypothetical protein
MTIGKCHEGNFKCFCGLKQESAVSTDAQEPSYIDTIEQDTLPEQNYIFKSLRTSLAKPKEETNFPYPFFFHILDGYRPEAVSLGHDFSELTPENARKFEDKIQTTAAEINRQSRAETDLNVIEILARACHDISDCRELVNGAQAFVAMRGQRISDTPSRLEQCLTIHSSPHPIDTNDYPHLLDQSGVYAVENYLGSCDELNEAYDRTIFPTTRHHGAVQRRRLIENFNTVPYLAAEHLILASTTAEGSIESEISTLKDLRPGMAILPFAVLGQCRAAGVWFYRGEFRSDKNSKLRDHLAKIGRFANTWLSLTVSQMIAHTSCMMILRALGSLQDASDMPLVHCRQVQRALCSLWFSRKLEVRRGIMKDRDIVHVNEGAEAVALRGISCQPIPLECTDLPEVSELLGFDKAYFDIPFYARNYNSELELIQPLFAHVSAGVLSEHQRARKRMKESFRRKLDITAHDYANEINGLAVFSDSMSDRASGLSPELRLQIVRRRASHMRGYAWILRAISKSEADSANTESRFGAGALSDIAFSQKNPTINDLTTWQNYLYWESLYTAFTAREKYKPVGKVAVGEFHLRYRFECNERLSSDEFVAPWECDTVVDADALASGLKDRFDRQRPHWPLQASNENSTKLNDLGRTSVMLWGALELIRNACEETALLLSNKLASSLSVYIMLRIFRDANIWKFQIIIENTATKAPEMEEFQWYGPMCQLMPNIKLKKLPSNGKATYEFEMEVPNANS